MTWFMWLCIGVFLSTAALVALLCVAARGVGEDPIE